ncbi:MAG: hypothetical protein WBA97_38500 [Actinophytocola sp.]|uniref:hypothetical protein n=1 Tax=Actinophytocola sp. TaxID=1872138 RepID=UPI003C765C8E
MDSAAGGEKRVAAGAALDPELHDVRFHRRAGVDQTQALPPEAAEVDEQVDAFGRGDGQPAPPGSPRGGQQTRVRADDPDRVVVHDTGLVDQVEAEEAAVRRVEGAEAVPAGVDVEVGPADAVDEGERAGDGSRGAGRRQVLELEQQLPGERAGRRVSVEVAVGDDQRDLVVAAG